MSQGQQGIQGIQGEQGQQGIQGVQGIQGNIGLQGDAVPISSSLVLNDPSIAGSSAAIYELNKKVAELTAVPDATTAVKGIVRLSENINEVNPSPTDVTSEIAVVSYVQSEINGKANTSDLDSKANIDLGNVSSISNSFLSLLSGEGVGAIGDATTTNKGIVQLSGEINSLSPSSSQVPSENDVVGYAVNRSLSNVTSLSNNFLNLMSQSGKTYITDTWKSQDGESWARKWSDGFIEQGGSSYGITNPTINLPFPMQSTDYKVFLSQFSEHGTSFTSILQPTVQVRNESNFTCYAGDNSFHAIFWLVTGY